MLKSPFVSLHCGDKGGLHFYCSTIGQQALSQSTALHG